MNLIENNVLHVNGETITVEFQPSADQAWQCWAANVLPASATYPSPYANVHKSQLTKIHGSIGDNGTDTWNPPTMETRKTDLNKLTEFQDSLATNISDANKHSKELEFMAKEGLRQLGAPRIGIFADRIRPEPLHLEINNWQHVLDLLYKEAVRRGKFKDFITILKNPVNVPPESSMKPGCGLKFLACRIEEHYNIESHRMNKLDTRLIGSQAISLAQFSYRIVDCLSTAHDSMAMEIKSQALAKICQTLRDIGALINRINVSSFYVEQVASTCQLYFNLFSLFFNESCQSTVWTLGYALPYHAQQLYEKYKIGYGILTMQGKESKHSAIKQELRNGTNRWNTENSTSKWHQIMRSSYVRNFYLPYHFPISSGYHSHYRSRVPALHGQDDFCACCRPSLLEEEICFVCKAAEPILESATEGKLSPTVLHKLKPIKCRECEEYFPDFISCDNHVKNRHAKVLTNCKNIIPSILTVAQLKVYLSERKLSTSGNKDVLRRRLEGTLTTEM